MSARLVKLAAAVASSCCAMFALESVAHAKGCTEVSDIVGYEKCHRYGDGWAVERRWPIGLALSFPYQTFDPNGIGFDFLHGKNDPHPFTLAGDKLGAASFGAAGFNIRLEGFVFGWLYLGFEWGLGFGHNQINNFTALVDNVPTNFVGSDAAVNTTDFHGGAFAGVRIPLGRVSLRLEGFAGGDLVSISAHSPLGDYMGSAGRGQLAPRAVVDLWASPNVTFSAYGGINAVDTKERTLGLMLEYHVRSFDGAFALW
jgi:hypothetical protein